MYNKKTIKHVHVTLQRVFFMHHVIQRVKTLHCEEFRQKKKKTLKTVTFEMFG